MHVIAAKAVASGALRPAFKPMPATWWRTLALAETLKSRRPRYRFRRHRYPSHAGDSGPSGSPERSRRAPGRAYITCNKNAFHSTREAGDHLASGWDAGRYHPRLRIAEFQEVGDSDRGGARRASQKQVEEDLLTEAAVREKVKRLVARFPIITGEGASPQARRRRRGGRRIPCAVRIARASTRR
jgi:glycine hydroxymethyltransferase